MERGGPGLTRYTKEQRARDWQFVFASPEGRRALSSLFADCGLFATTHDPNPQVASFNEGRRAAALDIVQALEVRPETFRKISEAMKEQFTDD